MSNKQTIIDNNARIDALTKRVNQSGTGYKDMLQARVDATNSCAYLFYLYNGKKVDFLENLDTSNVTTMEKMFDNCSNLTSIPLLDTSNVTTMTYMFNYCSNLIAIPTLNTSKVDNMSYMFYSCKKLTEIPQLDTGSCTTMENMFAGCSSLSEIPQLNTSNVTNMIQMMFNCSALTTIPELDTRKVTTMKTMFNSCYKLTTIPLLDMISVTNTSQMFTGASKITNLTLKNLKTALSISTCTLLTLDSLINTIKELWDLTGSTGQKLTMGTTNREKIVSTYVKLIDVTDDMIAADEHIASKKPCVVCESTDEGAMTLEAYANLKNWTIA